VIRKTLVVAGRRTQGWWVLWLHRFSGLKAVVTIFFPRLPGENGLVPIGRQPVKWGPIDPPSVRGG
jgi:hypothetical protein